jgi:hypothetical protein
VTGGLPVTMHLHGCPFPPLENASPLKTPSSFDFQGGILGWSRCRWISRGRRWCWCISLTRECSAHKNAPKSLSKPCLGGGVSVGFPWGFRGLPGLSRGLLGHSGEWGAFPLAGPAAGGLVGVAGGVVANCWWPSAGAGSRNKSVKNRNQQTPKVNGKHG